MGRRERNINVWLPLVRSLLRTWPPTQAYAPDWELYWLPFGSQAGTQSTEPHQPENVFLILVSVAFTTLYILVQELLLALPNIVSYCFSSSDYSFKEVLLENFKFS